MNTARDLRPGAGAAEAAATTAECPANRAGLQRREASTAALRPRPARALRARRLPCSPRRRTRRIPRGEFIRSGGGLALALAAVVLAPAPLAAHTGVPPAPHDAWRAWSTEPAVLIGIALGLLAYTRGVRAAWARAGRGRVFSAGAFRRGGVGFIVIALALVTPVDAVGNALFAGHMVQHLLLVAVAAPLLVAGDAASGVFRALPAGARKRLGRGMRRAGLVAGWRALRQPGPAWLLHVAVLWLWHLPAAYDAAVRSDGVHALEHATMLGTAIVFWIPVLSPGARARMPRGAAILYLFAFGMQASLLGALLTFSAQPWYAAHVPWTAAWGLSPLQDQHLAGAIMWVPGGLAYLGAMAGVFLRWMREMEARTPALAPEGAR